jgi:hypothetical protein
MIHNKICIKASRVQQQANIVLVSMIYSIVPMNDAIYILHRFNALHREYVSNMEITDHHHFH